MPKIEEGTAICPCCGNFNDSVVDVFPWGTGEVARIRYPNSGGQVLTEEYTSNPKALAGLLRAWLKDHLRAQGATA